MTLEGGQEGRFTFQAAPVRKPLLAVSSVNDKGNLVLFDGDESYIIPGKAAAWIKATSQPCAANPREGQAAPEERRLQHESLAP